MIAEYVRPAGSLDALELFDCGLNFSKPLTARKHTIHVMSIGTRGLEA